VRLKKMNRVVKGGLIAGVVTIAVLGSMASSCGNSGSKAPARSQETNRVQSNYDKLVKNQPAHEGPYSPTRDTKNFWIDTWMHDPKKLSYVYITQGDKTGYFVLQGLPVSYCTSLLPPEQYHRYDMGEDGSAGLLLKAPSMDGSYSSGADCTTKYGKDATTGAYVEFTVGQNQSYFLYDQPMPSVYPDAVNKGPTKIVGGKAVKP
jgi:hypothetical protein